MNTIEKLENKVLKSLRTEGKRTIYNAKSIESFLINAENSVREAIKSQHELNAKKEKTELDMLAINNYAQRLNDVAKFVKMFHKFIDLAIENSLTLSKSPYSNSYYAHKKGEKISWGHKPENSLRLANHWNWKDEDGEEVHCPTLSRKDYGLAICVFENNVYKKYRKTKGD